MLHMISFYFSNFYEIQYLKKIIAVTGKIRTIKEHTVEKTNEDSLAAVSIYEILTYYFYFFYKKLISLNRSLYSCQ